MSYQKPTLSILTVCFNSEQTIRRSIDSVIAQKQFGVEYIIIDGKSRDNTMDIIRSYGQLVDKVISEPDNGIYDAMNKAIQYASGRWLLFLGSDDKLLPNAIHNFINICNEDYVMMYGIVELSNGKIFRSTMGLKLLLWNTVHHQGAFYRNDVFDSFLYDTQFGIMSDYELNLRLYLEKKAVCSLPFRVSLADTGGISSKFWQPMQELLLIHNKVFDNKVINVLANGLVIGYYWLVVCKLIFKKYILKKDTPRDLNI